MANVSTISWPLRSSVRSPESSRFFASCCVMVEPPTILTGLGGGAVHHVNGQGAGREHVCRHGHTGSREAGRRAVDEQIEAGATGVQPGAAQGHAILFSTGKMTPDDGLSLFHRAIGQHDGRRLGSDQRTQHAA